MIHQNTTLERLSDAHKVLFTGFLLVIGFGLLMAGVQIMLTHGKADGKPGLSIDDIIYSYYGNRTGSKLETMLKGQMKAMAPDEVRLDMIKWAEEGAPITEWTSKIKPQIDQYCIGCHKADSGLPDFTKLENVQKVAEVDHGASITLLTRVSHIHLFGIAFIFMSVGWIFTFAEFPKKWKLILIATPFAFLLVDVMSWWLTKFFSIFAWLTMIGGVGYSLASTAMILTSLAQMWLPRQQWLKYWTSEQPASGDQP